MKNLFPLLCLTLGLAAADLQIAGTHYRINDQTGAIASIMQGGKAIVASAENQYLLMSPKGDATGLEREDRATALRRDGEALVYTCANPKLPGVTITKRYFPCNGGLRRTLSYHNGGTGIAFLLTFTELHFPPDYRKGLWHLGAGYIGPYKPFPQVDQPRPVNEYRQSSKGLVFVHPDGRETNFCHYRVKINEQVVLPWFHSTIGHYREYADRLWYLPDGYRMGLGTLDLQPGKSISVTDFLRPFPGDLYSFFEDVFTHDPEVMAEINSIPKGPQWGHDIFMDAGFAVLDYIRWTSALVDEGIFFNIDSPFSVWGDYRVRDEKLLPMNQGGAITPDELRQFFALQRSLSPRALPSTYHIVISATRGARILKEHPEWFRFRDRSGKLDSLFPGAFDNFQTMFCYPECRKFLVDSLFDYTDFAGEKSIYIDEAQMTSTIDWERLALTRDDHTVLFWKALKARAAKEGILLFFNGSGNPYADLNFMESPHEMAPHRWRDWVGVAWGIGMFNRMRPGNRAVPLYWNSRCDYVNRFLALGWIPVPVIAHATLPPMRAAFETGNLVPMRIRHSPDWMQDYSVEVETHTMMRPGASERLLSFISRAAKPQDIPVSIDLATLGYPPDTRINLWKLVPRYDKASKRSFFLADRELKANWRDYRWDDGNAMMAPALVYSGPAAGVFQDTLGKLAPNEMVQFLAVPGPASVRAVADLPKNYFYACIRHARIDGRRAVLEKPADILLIDREKRFTKVTVDGQPAQTRPIDIGGVLGTLVALPKGTHTLEWHEESAPAIANTLPGAITLTGNHLAAGPDGTLLALELHGRTVCTAPSPITLPPQRENGTYRVRLAGSTAARTVRIDGGKGTDVPMFTYHYAPEETYQQAVSVKHGEVTVTRRAGWISTYEDVVGYQRNLAPAVAEADPQKLAITAGTSRRDAGANLALHSFAGLELKGARQLHLRFRHTFGTVQAQRQIHVRKGAGAPHTNFAGLVLDFRGKDGKYAKRVALAAGLFHPDYTTPDPPHWGTGGKPDALLELGDLISGPGEQLFSLDLERLAPKDWDGTAFLSVGTARILPNRRITLEILGFNNKDAKDFLTPELPLAAGARTMPKPLRSKRLRKPPAALSGKLDPAEWRQWAPFDRFQPLGTDPKAILRAGTKAYLAHDYEYIYLAVEAAEPGRPPVCNSAVAWNNERIEFYILRPDKKLCQVVADAKGKLAYLLNNHEADPEGILCKAETVPGKGWRLLLAIPVDSLKFDMQQTPVIVKGNLCRARLKPNTEYSTWSPLKGGFHEPASFSSLIFDFE